MEHAPMIHIWSSLDGIHKENTYQRYLKLFRYMDIKKIFIKDIWSSLDGTNGENTYKRYLELFRLDTQRKYISKLYEAL